MSARQEPERRYSRLISPNEWLALCRMRGVSTEVQLCVEGDGDIDPAALAAAVEAASAACPGSRVARRGTRWVDSGRAPAVSTVQADRFDRARLDSPLLRTNLTGERSTPTSEVILVQGTPATVIFRACHSAMDGAGTMLWQRQVFRALRGEPLEGATSTLNYTDIQEAIAARLGIEMPPVRTPSGESFGSPLGDLPRGARRSIWRRRVVDGIHTGVSAKIARQIASCEGAQGLINIPVDMRQYLPGLRTTAGASAYFLMPARADEDWAEVHARLLAALHEHTYLTYRDEPAVLGTPLPVMAAVARWGDDQARADGDLINARGWCDCMAAVSHLGTVDLADFCADGFTATAYYTLGSVMYPPEVNIVEYAGRTEVTLAWRDGPGVAERAEALLDRIEEDLSPRAHRVWEGNQTGREAPPASLTRMFAEQAARTPDAIAISGQDGDMTYAELDQRSAAVAAALRALGIGRDDPVGLVTGRSADAIVAIWGILRAGAGYMPIDDSNPDARIAQLLADARAAVCLLESPSAGRDCLPPGCQGISLDALPRTRPADWQDADCGPGDLANVVYTSGSTGAPKGAEIEHRALVNFVGWATREAGIDGSTRIPLVSSMSFDIIGFSIFLPLLAGGTVLPVREVNAITLREVIEDDGTNAIAVTPSHLDLISHAGVRRSALRVVICGGELLRRSTALRALDAFGPQCRILNVWGPTEATITNTTHYFDPERDTEAGVPIGRPMDNNTIYLLDSRGRHVPPGEPGEACVGGTQLARGYLARPDLTRQKFTRLADGTRIYRTGDIVRLLPAGDLAFISRADDQVKIAGHRIEPAEITQALENHPAITAAAVIPRTRPGRHDKELCAYIVTTTGTTPHDLKTHLTTHLPRYMHPATTTVIPAIPRTPNGKTDHRQLPDPFTTHHPPPPPTPHDDITTTITHIWAHTLNTDPTTLDEHADFRDLGGGSVLLLTMIDEVSKTMGADAQAEFMDGLHQVFRQPTLGQVCDLAKHASMKHAAG